ncbi:hypothetical protein [Streptomyces sp. NPDC093094]|uniref:hypothetical protein n=1 Tax=Streptomyces sp. NPDC093094 TaxID=3366026 RepID=UPI0038008BF7
MISAGGVLRVLVPPLAAQEADVGTAHHRFAGRAGRGHRRRDTPSGRRQASGTPVTRLGGQSYEEDSRYEDDSREDIVTEHRIPHVPTAGHTPDDDLTGYQVDATDGRVGSVSPHSRDLGRRFLVVHTGLWFLGKDVVIPSDAVMGIDHVARIVNLARTKAQAKAAPVFDEDTYLGDPRHRDQLGGRHGSGH